MSEIYFYKYLVTSQVFYRSKYTYALVNLRPLVPGHVLVVPLRTSALRLGDLSLEESSDYMNTLQVIHKFIEKVYKADSLNIAIQDGPESGQSVPHLHTHIIPRYKNDKWGDSIYQALEKSDLEQQYQEFFTRKTEYREHTPEELNQKDEDRMNRSEAEMAKETNWLRTQLASYLEEKRRLQEEDREAAHFDFERVFHDKSY